MKEIISSGFVVLQEMEPHRNRGLEITYIGKGDLDWIVEGRREEVRQGMVFFTLPWQAHGSAAAREPRNEACHLLLRLPGDPARPRRSFQLPPKLGLSAKEARELSAVLCRATRHGWWATPAFRWAIEALVGDLEQERRFSEAYRAGLLRVVLIELARVVSGDSPASGGLGRPDRRVHALLDRLSAAPGEPWTMARMSAACGLRHSRLSAVVRQLTGCSPWEYLLRLRVNRAQFLLRHSNRSVTDIGLECGFASSQHFADAFKKQTGLTPTGCRRDHGASEAASKEGWRLVGWRSLREERERVRRFKRRKGA